MGKSRQLSRPGSLNLAFLAIAASLAGGSIAFVSMNSTAPSQTSTVRTPGTAVSTTAGAALHQLRLCGLGPEEFAVAGVNAESLAVVVEAGAGYIHEYGELATPLQASQSANARYALLRRQIESGTATPEQKAALADAIASKNAASAALSGSKTAYLNAALTALPEEVRRRLDALVASGDRHIPAEFRVVAREDAEWLALREAVAAERIALRKQQPVPPGAAGLLADARALPATATARASLDANLSALKAVFDPPRAKP